MVDVGDNTFAAAILTGGETSLATPATVQELELAAARSSLTVAFLHWHAVLTDHHRHVKARFLSVRLSAERLRRGLSAAFATWLYFRAEVFAEHNAVAFYSWGTMR